MYTFPLMLALFDIFDLLYYSVYPYIAMNSRTQSQSTKLTNANIQENVTTAILI